LEYVIVKGMVVLPVTAVVEETPLTLPEYEVVMVVLLPLLRVM
jgi:hypothetical protein